MPTKAELARAKNKAKAEIVRRIDEVERQTQAAAAADVKAVAPLDAGSRRRIVDTFRFLLEGLYVHLPQKRSSYGFDPTQRLRLLGERASDPVMTDDVFHREMAQILTDLRDAHTRYLGPQHKLDEAWFLPLMVERYVDADGRTRFIASKVEGLDRTQKTYFTKHGFRGGVEITHWNGVPMERAVDLYADRETGGRTDARVARALESLTARPTRFALPPDEQWVDIGFETARGAEREVRVPWRRIGLTPGPPRAPGTEAQALAYDPVADRAREVKKMLFAPTVWLAELSAAGGAATKSVAECVAQDNWSADSDDWVAGRFAANVAAKVVTHRRRRYGYLRIYSFQLQNDQAFLDEVEELLDLMPSNGLIIDIRSNPGGLIWAAEGLLQLLTPNRISPTRFSLVATDMTRAMAGKNRALQPWADSLEDAVTTGVTHSRPVALTPLARCNNRGQRYGGPVVCVVDANTYSAGDLFAAGFVDNDVGKLISTDAATGGGGANVWAPRDVSRALAGTGHELDELGDVAFTVSVRRAERIGDAGIDIEDTGVTASFRHEVTKDDLTERNRDLIAYAAGLLAAEELTDLEIEPKGDTLLVRTRSLDRVQLDFDGVPRATQPVEQGGATFELTKGWDQHVVEVVGYRGPRVRQRRRVKTAG